jgi:hypothetical protein
MPGCAGCIKSDPCPADDRAVVSTRNGLILALQTAALLAALAAAVITSEASDWRPLSLVFVLFALAVASDVMTVEMKGLRISGAFFAVVLGMVFLGPAPPVASRVGATIA